MPNPRQIPIISQLLRWLSPLATAIVLPGCLSPIALNNAVMAYDQSTSDIQSQQLLLNVARAHQHQPLHFTGISNIAATFNFQFNAGATPALTGESGSLLTPIFGGTVSENPTISIVPIEGEEFTQRLLTPFHEHKLTMLLRQGADIDLVLRLLAGELRLKGNTEAQDAVFYNKPSDKTGYKRFRQLVTQISTVQDRHRLFVEPLQFEQSWHIPADTLAAEQFAGLQKEYDLDFDAAGKRLTLTKRLIGHTVITNYDPQSLTNAQRIALNDEANKGLLNDVMVDIRSDYPGGEVPVHGFFRLRSFYNVVNFLGRGIDDESEYPVEKLQATPHVKENPIHTLGISVTEDAPNDDSLYVEYAGNYYAIAPEAGYQWNREGFRLLHQLFQMTMTELAQRGAPTLTISK